jgi:hypothetical protein
MALAVDPEGYCGESLLAISETGILCLSLLCDFGVSVLG